MTLSTNAVINFKPMSIFADHIFNICCMSHVLFDLMTQIGYFYTSINKVFTKILQDRAVS